MCGILGSVNTPFDNDILDTIKHRGPDDFGIETFDVASNMVTLSQRRLSIIDLSPAGHQPMNTLCGNYSIIFNGEIYNYQDLKDRLPKDIVFRGHSDTETILYYLKEFGIKGISDFNGIFSIAFLDKLNNKLFLVRDHFGVKPMYYYHRAETGQLIFSSEIRPIKALIGRGDLDNDALATLLRLRFNPAPDTLYKQIKKVRPAHYLELDLNDRPSQVKHHSYAEQLPVTVNYPDVVNLYGQNLEQAVKRQLLSDVEVGILLSGGIDSAVVAALAHKHYPNRLKAFTIGFEGDYQEDEIADAAETAEILGLEHYYRKISFTGFLSLIKECTRIVEEPLATTSMIPMYYLSELASEKVKVVLTGQGADEPLGGYTKYKSELLLNQIPRFIQTMARPFARMMNSRDEKIIRGIKTLGIKDDVTRFLANYELFTEAEISGLISTTDASSRQSINHFYELLNCKVKEYPVERMMALDTRLNLADDLLNYTDKITMNFSMECRVPMLDTELVKFIESLPAAEKLNFKGGKLVHKKFAEQLLPAKIINRPKKGFLSPTNSWFRNEAGAIKEILLSGGSNFSKVFDQKYVAEIIDQHKSGLNREKQIFLLLSIYFWFELQ
ncbi:MAG TPA: asparagine synthase (glutamine-hydrolyzing) [Mucilaginibacter sp.]|jgi:asparagine synthase (glutamine-hydrolysing)|nr:asparagine synthase (glutamine-hydrolyzing) [Mucilaginibacter sp.]